MMFCRHAVFKKQSSSMHFIALNSEILQKMILYFSHCEKSGKGETVTQSIYNSVACY